jgi:hypothetical protein
LSFSATAELLESHPQTISSLFRPGSAPFEAALGWLIFIWSSMVLQAAAVRSDSGRRGSKDQTVMVSDAALTRFHDYGSALRQLYGASGECRHRLNAALGARHTLQAERDRVARDRHAPWTHVQEAVAEKLEHLNAQLARANEDVQRLQRELDAIEARREQASALVGNLKEFLLARGVSRNLLKV